MKKVYLFKTEGSNYKIGTSKKYVYIYSISDSSGIRYVGKTNNLKVRAKNHILETNKKINNHRVNWLKSLINNGEPPIFEILDIVPKNSWVFWEKYWISQIKSWGSASIASRSLKIHVGNILNCTNGRRNKAGGYKWEKCC